MVFLTTRVLDHAIASLAKEFKFSERKARLFLKLPVEISQKEETAAKNAIAKKPVEKKPVEKKTVEKKPASRGPTGYHLFLKDQAPKSKLSLEHKLKKGEKLERGAIVRDVGAKWKELTDSQKLIWNQKAA